MLSFGTTCLLKTALETISETEMVVEDCRQALCREPNFAPYSAFCRIDRGAQECIDARAICAFLKDNSCNAQISDCARLLKFFDSDEDGLLSYSDFMQIVLPCDDNMLRAQVQKRPYTRVGRFDSLPHTLELNLIRLLQHELAFIGRMKQIVRDLKLQPDYTCYAAFRTVDKYQEGAINVANLQDFFRGFGNYLVEQEVFAVVRRIDTDGDAKVSFEEFAEFFQSDVNEEAPLIAPRHAIAQANSNKKKPAQKLVKGKVVREEQFPVESAMGGGIQRLIEQYSMKKAYREARENAPQVSPVQRNPVRKVHFSSPLRPSKSASKASSYGGMTASRSTAANSDYVQSRRFDGPIRQETEAGVVRMLTQQVDLDRQVEMAKNETVTRPDFNTHDAFRIFDIDNLGSVSVLDVHHGLQDIGVHVTVDDVHLFFQKHDKDRDGRLDYREFSEAFTPQDPYYAQMLARRPSTHQRINVYKKDDVFAYSTGCSYKDLLRTMISTEGAAEATRQQLDRDPYFDSQEAFRQCDQSQNGRVGKDDIRYFMESRGNYISDSEARTLASKMDINRDGIVTRSEFMESVRPKSPSRRF